MFKKFFIAASLLCLCFAVSAQNAANSTQNAVYVGKKCPTCPELTKLNYSRDGFRETLTSPDTRASWVIDWETNLVEAGGKKYRFHHYTNDQRQSVTVEWTDDETVMLIESYYTAKAEYIGSKFGK